MPTPTATSRRRRPSGAQRGSAGCRGAPGAAAGGGRRRVGDGVAHALAPEYSLRRAMISAGRAVDQQGDDEEDEAGGDQRVPAELVGLAELGGDVLGEGAAARVEQAGRR